MMCSYQLMYAVLAASMLAFCGCVGGSGGSGGGGGNPTITTLSPSNIMVGVPLGTLLITGSNFNSDALIAIDGQEVSTAPFTWRANSTRQDMWADWPWETLTAMATLTL